MLINIRRSHKFITAVVIVVVIMFSSTIFFAWVFSFLDVGKPYVAKVNDYTVTQIEYENALQQDTQRYIAQNPASINFTKTTEFSLQTIDSLVDNALLRQYGKSISLEISEYEVGNTIINSLGGINNFNERDYLNFLNSYGLSVEDYEAIVRDNLLVNKVRSLITSSVTTSDEELASYYKGVFRVYNIDTLTLKPSDFASQVEISDALLEEYYNANLGNYSVEESGDVVVVTASINDLRAEAVTQPTSDDLMAFYQQNLQQYSSQPSFVVNTLTVSSDDLTVAQSEVTAFISEINNNGGSFDTYASFFGDTTTVGTPEYNRTFSQSNIPAEFTFTNSLSNSSAFFSQKGDSFYIAQLQSTTEEQPKPFDMVATQVRADYIASQSQNSDPVGDLVAEANNNGGIYYLNDTYGLPLQEMNNINESTVLPFLGDDDIYAILDAPVGDVQTFESQSDGKAYFVAIVDHRPTRVKSLDEAMGDGSLKADFTIYAGAMLAKEYAASVLPSPTYDNPKMGTKEELTTYNLDNVADLLQGDQERVSKFIALGRGESMDAPVVNNDGSVVLIKKVESYGNPSSPSFREFEDRARREVIAGKREAAMAEFLQSLRDNASIKINKAYQGDSQ